RTATARAAAARARGARAAPPRARGAPAAAARAPLRRRDLLGRHGLRELRNQLPEEVAHALLLTTDGARELRRLLVVDGLGERLDAPLDLAAVILGLLEMLLEALLVRRTSGHRDVRLERRLELLFLAVRLVQILNELRVFCLQLVGHEHVSFRSLQ